MRLRLSIQRHALPITNIVWTVRAQDPTSTSAHSYATISQLLEDINDIVQLESDDWGFEDYAVEVDGYECLHFQPVESVLKEDDEVTIRALLTNDLRARRLGGRRQITADGKHLLDGVAFGRPYLRRTARPSLRIPPRKRRKLDLGHGQYIEDDSAFLHSALESEASPYRALLPTENEPDLGVQDGSSSRAVSKPNFDFTGLDSSDSEDDDDFDGDDESSTDDEEAREALEVTDELETLLEEDPVPPQSAEDDNGRPGQFLQPGSQADGLSAPRRLKRKLQHDGASEDETADHMRHSDQQLYLEYAARPDTERRIALDKGEARVEERESPGRSNGTSIRSENTSSRVTSSPVEIESDNSSTDSTSSASTSGSSSDSQSGRGSESEFTSDSQSETESTSASLSESEREGRRFDADSSQVQSRETRISITTSAHKPTPAPVPPGKGLRRTQRNNKRNQKKKILVRLKANGLLTPDAGFSELSAYTAAQHQTQDTHSVSQERELAQAIETRKHELLQQLPPVRLGSDRALQQFPVTPDQPAAEPATQELTASTAPVRQVVEEPVPQVRAKLDLNSSRRMVFGSLGLKTPKTPTEEQALRERLAKNVANPANKLAVALSNDTSGTHRNVLGETSRAESWREKIELSAVECQMKNRILSQPPFPFVQHWEQRFPGKEARGRADEHGVHSSGQSQCTGDATCVPLDSSPFLEGDRIPEEVGLDGDIQKQLTQEAQELSTQDYTNQSIGPDMPLLTDPSGLEILRPEDAVVGNVVAFKQLEVSIDTNWQPQVSTYRTAKVQEILSDGTLKILLAKRDRIPESRLGDLQTTGRTYQDFEMPLEESQEGPDSGIREIVYADLIEPKLVERVDRHVSTDSVGEELQASRPGSWSSESMSQANGSDPSNDGSTEQVEVSTPRQKEIAKIMQDAGFDSSLDPGLLQPPPAPITGVDTLAPATASEEPSNHQPLNLDGANTEFDAAPLNSPRYTPWDSSFDNQENDFYDASSILGAEVRSPGVEQSSKASEAVIQKDVRYPRLSQLVLHSVTPPLVNGNAQSAYGHSIGPPESGQRPNHEADDKNDETTEAGASAFSPMASASYLDSLKSTIPPTDDTPPTHSRPASSCGSRITNPVYDSGEESDLPSLSEITSTAQSRKVSPPPLKKPGKMKSSNGVVKQKKEPEGPDSAAGPPSEPELPSNVDNGSPESKSQATLLTGQSSSGPSQNPEIPYSQPPPGSQLIDLTQGSSDPISPLYSDDDYRATQGRGGSIHTAATTSHPVPARKVRGSQAKKTRSMPLSGRTRGVQRAVRRRG